MSDIRKILNTLTEMTSGSVASVAMPLQTQRRDHLPEQDTDKPNAPEVLEYGNWENSSLTTSKKLKQTRGKAKKLVKKIYGEAVANESMDGVSPSTKMFTSESKTKNPVARAAQRVAKGSGKHKNPAKVLARKAKHKKMYEEEITEQDLIISPVIKRVRDRDLISRDHSRVDREVEMARGDCRQAIQNAEKILARIENRSEDRGLEGWVQEKIIKASDYLNTVREYLENQSSEHDEMDDMDPRLDVAEGFIDDMPAGSMVDTMNKIRDDAKSQRYLHLQKLLKKSKNPKTIAQIKALLSKEFPQDVEEGLSDVVKGIKRSIKGKEHPDVVAAKHAGRAIGHYNQGDIESGDKETKRYVKTRDMHLKAKGVTEGNNSSPYDEMARLKSKTNKELDELVQFWQKVLEKRPDDKIANDQLHIIKMIRAERIGKKGVTEGLTWSSLDKGLSVDDKMTIFEEYHLRGNLTESLDENKKDYFVSLFDMSDVPVKNKKYIVAPLSLVGNRILTLDQPSYLEFLGKSQNQLVFKSSTGELRYPSKTMRDMSVYNTFTFSSQAAYDKFRSALRLKFDIVLPEINLLEQGVTEGKQEYKLNLESIEKRFGEIKLTEGIVRNNQSLLRYLAKNNVSTEVFDHIIEQKIRAVMKDKTITESIDKKDKNLNRIFSEFNNFSTGNNIEQGDSVSVLNLEALQLSNNTIELTGFLKPQKVKKITNNYVEFESGETFPKQKIVQTKMWRQVIFFDDVEQAKKCVTAMSLHSGKVGDWEFSIKVNDNEQDVAEDLDANQKRVKQLGPTEKIGKQGARGKLVGGH